METTKEIIKQLIKEEQFGSTKEIMDSIKNMFKEILQESLEAELDEQLGYGRYEKSAAANRRNGHSKKILKSEFGDVEIAVLRDRNGEYEPKLIPKHSRSVEGLEEKVLSLYAAGLSTRDIHAQIKELYGVEISAEQVSRITDRVTEWSEVYEVIQQRKLKKREQEGLRNKPPMRSLRRFIQRDCRSEVLFR